MKRLKKEDLEVGQEVVVMIKHCDAFIPVVTGSNPKHGNRTKVTAITEYFVFVETRYGAISIDPESADYCIFTVETARELYRETLKDVEDEYVKNRLIDTF